MLGIIEDVRPYAMTPKDHVEFEEFYGFCGEYLEERLKMRMGEPKTGCEALVRMELEDWEKNRQFGKREIKVDSMKVGKDKSNRVFNGEDSIKGDATSFDMKELMEVKEKRVWLVGIKDGDTGGIKVIGCLMERIVLKVMPRVLI